MEQGQTGNARQDSRLRDVVGVPCAECWKLRVDAKRASVIVASGSAAETAAGQGNAARPSAAQSRRAPQASPLYRPDSASLDRNSCFPCWRVPFFDLLLQCGAVSSPLIDSLTRAGAALRRVYPGAPFVFVHVYKIYSFRTRTRKWLLTINNPVRSLTSICSQYPGSEGAFGDDSACVGVGEPERGARSVPKENKDDGKPALIEPERKP